MSLRIGVDVGGTSIRLRPFPGSVENRLVETTDAEGGEEVAERIVHLVGKMMVRTGRPASVGVGIPGQVDPLSGTVRHAVNLGIDGTPFPLFAFLAARLQVPIYVENDVRTATLGAYHLLRPERPELASLVYLSAGTGVSAGVVIEGRLHRGRHGIAGEIGHAPLGGDEIRCSCGLLGCLEAVVGGKALDQRIPGGARNLFRRTGGVPPHEAERVATALARGLYVLATTYDPDLFVLGGSIGRDAFPRRARRPGRHVGRLPVRGGRADTRPDCNAALRRRCRHGGGSTTGQPTASGGCPRRLLSPKRLEASRARVGALRRWLGRFSRPDLDVVGCSEHALLAAEVARQSVTLVRDEDDLLPLRPRGRLLAVMPRPSDLTPADTSSTVPPLLAGALRRHHPHVTEVVTEPVPTAADIAGVRAAVERADMAVIGTITAGTEQATLVKSVLDCSKPTVTVALRTPFDLAAYPAAAVHLCTYSLLPPSMEALADVIFGAAMAVGRLPAAIAGHYPRGHRWPA